MTNHRGVNVDCLLVGEYVDEAPLPTDLAFHQGEVIRPHVVATYLDLWDKADGLKDFTVLLKDNRRVVVRGHSLKHFPTTIPGESGSYGVAIRTASEEVLVALFNTCEVIGIFNGEISSERKIA